jgi:Ulp1 family protease
VFSPPIDSASTPPIPTPTLHQKHDGAQSLSLQGLQYTFCDDTRKGRSAWLELNSQTIESLQDTSYIDHSVIDYRIAGMNARHRTALANGNTIAKVYAFYSIFYCKLIEPRFNVRRRRKDKVFGDQLHQAMFDNVKLWTKGDDIFAYDYILVPIHNYSHWSLAIICHPGAHDESAYAFAANDAWSAL